MGGEKVKEGRVLLNLVLQKNGNLDKSEKKERGKEGESSSGWEWGGGRQTLIMSRKLRRGKNRTSYAVPEEKGTSYLLVKRSWEKGGGTQ